MDDHGYTVAVFNRTTSKVDHFLSKEAQGTKVIGTHSLQELVSVLKRPRRVMIMVEAGWPVDDSRRATGAVCWKRVTSSSMVATATIQIRHGVQKIWPQRAFCLSAQAYPAAKRGPGSARPSCPVARGSLAPRQADLPEHCRQSPGRVAVL